ncbi:hypothetical protein BDF22DRAFT_620573 [Syncephalis plumigaleata]|nr:hypothetical protein BDF22DRAFT_620573 [Syncephalis plumigaleata]
MGTWSHASPQLVLSDVLVERGHKVAFASYNTSLDAWLKDYPHVQPVDMGTNPMLKHIAMRSAHRVVSADQAVDFMEMERLLHNIFGHSYRDTYTFYRNHFTNHPVDVVICDFFNPSCHDAAYEFGLPFVVTMHMLGLLSQERPPYITNSFAGLPPTHETASFFERFYDAIVLPLRQRLFFSDTYSVRQAAMKELGIESYGPFGERWRHGLVLVNTFFGLELPQPVPPNTHLIGPTIPHKFKPLPDDLREFLDTHERTVYVGFGTAAILSGERISTILSALLVAHRDGLLDGVIWGLMQSATNEKSQLHTVTVDGVTHNIADMRSGKHPVVRLMDKAPQRAILGHSSTKLFISHCGVSSLFETMHAGVPIIGLPAFGDQENNAFKMTEMGAALWLPKTKVTQDTLYEKLSLLLSPMSDVAKTARDTMTRLQKMFHIANRDHTKAADFIEIAAIPGAMKSYQSADMRMPWWKAQNYDLYAFLVAVIGIATFILIFIIQYVTTLLPFGKRKEKQA